MAKKTGNYEIPFDKDGNQVSYKRHWVSYEDVDVPNFEFEDTLVLKDYAKGRSAVTISWVRESNGKEVTMFLSDFIPVAKVMCGGKIKGRFTFVKKGSNFGCTLLEVLE